MKKGRYYKSCKEFLNNGGWVIDAAGNGEPLTPASLKTWLGY